MSERHDTDDPGDDTETTPADSADRMAAQQAVEYEDTGERTHDSGSDHTTTSTACHGKTDGTNGETGPQELKPEDSQSAEQSQAVAARVGHNLKSSLSVARLRLDLARQEVNSDNLTSVAAALDRMETLIEDLQDGAATGVGITEFERVPLPDLVDQCWQHVAAGEATLHNMSALTLQADPSNLKRILENLFRNAIEHNDPDVHLKVGDLDEADGFYVADNGSGIPEHVRGTAFEPGVSTGCDGSGLGPSIVAQIAEAHDWHIRISESEAGGARFEITNVKFAAV